MSETDCPAFKTIYSKFFNSEEQEDLEQADKSSLDFISKILNAFALNYNENVLKSQNSDVIKGSLYNLDNYLCQKYVDSRLMIKNNDITLFYELAEDFYSNKDNFDFNNQGLYLFSAFLSNDRIESFSSEFNDDFYGSNIFAEMVNYFDNLKLYLENNYSNNINKGLIISFANRIIEVGNDIIKLNNCLDKLSNSKIDLIKDGLIGVKNTYISEILNG